MRTTGTTVIIEDVAFPIERLAEGWRGCSNCSIASNTVRPSSSATRWRNLHFVFTQGFDDPAQVARYGAFMDAVAELVAVRFGGSLKAEHGTGRNMAPYVELEWGRRGWR